MKRCTLCGRMVCAASLALACFDRMHAVAAGTDRQDAMAARGLLQTLRRITPAMRVTFLDDREREHAVISPRRAA